MLQKYNSMKKYVVSNAPSECTSKLKYSIHSQVVALASTHIEGTPAKLFDDDNNIELDNFSKKTFENQT